jgi:hypothetical protein
VWPWLGSGLLTSTGTVIEQHSANVSKVIETHSAAVAREIETQSVNHNKVNEHILLLLIA